MKHLLSIFILSMMLLAPMSWAAEEEHAMHQAPQAAEETPAATENESMYSCPMHPEVRQDEPGRCSICGMNLTLEEKAIAEQTKSETESTDEHEHSHAGGEMHHGTH